MAETLDKKGGEVGYGRHGDNNFNLTLQLHENMKGGKKNIKVKHKQKKKIKKNRKKNQPVSGGARTREVGVRCHSRPAKKKKKKIIEKFKL